MTKSKPAAQFVEGRGYSAADWDNVSDNSELTPSEMEQARPFAEVFPDLAEKISKGRGKQKQPTKLRVTLRLDRATIEAFKATGRGWQSRIDQALKTLVPR